MAVKKFDLIAIEFVIVGVELLNTPQSLGRFGSALREYRWTPISQAQNGFGDGRRVSLDRERIYLDLTATRSRVRQEYPAEDGFPDLAELVSRTIDLTDKPAGSVGPLGYNIEVSYEQDSERSAFSYIGQKVFAGLARLARFKTGILLAEWEPRFALRIITASSEMFTLNLVFAMSLFNVFTCT